MPMNKQKVGWAKSSATRHRVGTAHLRFCPRGDAAFRALAHPTQDCEHDGFLLNKLGRHCERSEAIQGRGAPTPGLLRRSAPRNDEQKVGWAKSSATRHRVGTAHLRFCPRGDAAFRALAHPTQN